MRATIRDVAKAAGVSTATVSRVLNKPDMVDPETMERVRAAMERMAYQPSAIARGLSAKRSDTLGLIVPGITDFFFNELYKGIDRASQQNGMKVLLYDSEHSRERALDGFSILGGYQVSGIIFTSKLVTEDYDPILQRVGIPVVLTLTQSEARTPLPSFRIDEVRAMFDVVAFLVTRGHQRIGMIAGRQWDDKTGELRLEGYRKGLRHFGIEYNEELVEYGQYRFDDGYQAMQRLLEKQPNFHMTALCTASDEMALGAIRCLNDNGLHVPEDISVVGFDDLPLARMITPRLTTVAQPFAEIGEAAVSWLVRAVGREPSPSEIGDYLLPHRLVERESVRALGS
ncbi:transcriptional regulator, LacI family [Alicyclobacillus hesperidum URH17-3-68]|uniref:Catabolite control protein A n=1 Tax=Alicyclobacillus hesperidum TaxID=89784 RepID=A0AA37X3U2_9BACL|nr:LacI family DNA-binding transcriptional regulator [Alicyclobacillus hesperidum]EJY54670.1 transcriptional regulator, LacI family [Alicyclobacillus hesperidum URH17-3-68]GLV12712.1 catabolite control protein A [Alicyclobacillus hesperidum]